MNLSGDSTTSNVFKQFFSSFQCMVLNVVIFFSRSPLSSYPLLCWPFWRYQWSYKCHCELDTKWQRQCRLLPHFHYHQCSPDPIWGTSEHHQCQCHTTWTDWFCGRLWVQHYSTWCDSKLWWSGGEGEWGPTITPQGLSPQPGKHIIMSMANETHVW